MTRCASNMRQIGVAITASAADNAGKYPVFDYSAKFTSKLKFIATVIDGPGFIRIHQYAHLYTLDQFIKSFITRFKV